MSDQTGRPSPPPPRPGPEELAAECLLRRLEGVEVNEEAYLARLNNAEERAEFRALVDSAQRAERTLPRALSRDTLIAKRYRLLHLIGGGGMGAVWSALDLELERNVAIKVLNAESQGRPDREAMFREESLMLAALKHPGIVAVHEFGRDRDLSYIVMDLIDGRSLSEVLERIRSDRLKRGLAPDPGLGSELSAAIGQPSPDGRLDLIDPGDWYKSVARIVMELARILEAAHGANVIHRDLKPSNVMLLGGGHPMVLDFGLAGTSDEEHGAVTRGLYGSMAYIAPEQASSGTVGKDALTDVYQIGLILYEMLTLKRAFPGTAIGEVLERIQNGQFASPRTIHARVPHDLEAICLQAMEVDPMRRYPSSRALREDLERYLEGREIPHAVQASHFHRRVRRARWWMRTHPYTATAAGMLAVGVAGWFAWHHSALAAPPRELAGVRMRLTADPKKLEAQGKEQKIEEPVQIEYGDPVTAGDGLGVVVHTDTPRYVYAFSVFKTADQQKLWVPVIAETVEEWNQYQAKGESAPPQAGWGRLVPGCKTSADCTQLVCASIDPANVMEGLIVLASREPQAYLETWYSDLRAHRDEHGEIKPVTEEIAEQILVQDPPTTRGGDAHDITPAQRTLCVAIKKGMAERPSEFKIPGFDSLRIECPVVGKR